MRTHILLALAGVALSFALPADPSPTASTTQEPCAQVSAYFAAAPPTSLAIVPAELAMNCLTSVPLSKANNTLLLEQLMQYIDFQTTFTYLKSPPSGYPYGGVDVIGDLQKLASDLKSDVYSDEYTFQAALVKIFQSARDGHFSYYPDIVLQSFAFKVLESNNNASSPTFLSLDSASLNGTGLPQIYVHSDILAYHDGDNSSGTISPVSRINGDDIEDALGMIADTLNNQDPDANYNALLYSQPLESIRSSNFDGALNDGLHYFGNQTVLEFANGTQRIYQNVAGALQSFSGIQSGEDVFQKFSTPAARFTQAKGYPHPIAIENTTAAVGGYFLDTDESDVAVLSLPSFLTTVQLEFSAVVGGFLQSATQAGKQRLIIDCRSNSGGDLELAYDTFKQLFPTLEPYGAVRAHASEAYNQLGSLASAVSPYTPGLNALSPAANPLVNYQLNVDEDNQNFGSWSDFYGPDTIYGDNFTSLFRQNLTNILSTNLFPLSGYNNRSNLPPQPFKSENIVILTDGVCGSTCAVFLEFMKTQGKVKSIAIGGRPQAAPMQAVGATKGARLIQFSTIYLAVISFAATMSASQLLSLSSGPLGAIYNATQPLIRTNGGQNAAVNGLNNYRMSDPTQTPLQFVYEAADCRLFYTPAMIQNVTNVWSAVADVQWGGPNSTVRCVAGSTGGRNSLSSGNTTVSGGSTSSDSPANSTASPSAASPNAASGLNVPALTACLVALAAALLV
ncbi:hypothetical protein MBLNU457_3168t1 [Dothideomycetes sp. NU457]